MATLLEYDGSGGAFSVGTKVSETTTTEVVGSFTYQRSDADAERIVSLPGAMNPDEFTFSCKFIYGDHSASPVNYTFFSSIDMPFGATGNYSFADSVTGDANDGLTVVLWDGVSSFTVGRWYNAAIVAMRTDGLEHKMEIRAKRTEALEGTHHVILLIDDVLVPLVDATTPITSPWPATTAVSNLGLNNNFEGTGRSGHMDMRDILITDVALPLAPAESIMIVENDVLDLHPMNSSEQGTFTIPYVYSGTEPTNADVRVYEKTSTNTVLVNGNTWNTLTDAVIGGGNGTGELSNVPKINDYLGIEIRKTNEITTTYDLVKDTGVGLLIAGNGQSNEENTFTYPSTGLTPHILTKKINDTAGTLLTNTGSAITLANIIQASVQCPVHLLDFGVGSSSLIESNDIGNGWWLTTSLMTPHVNYSNFLAAVTAVGGALHFVDHYLGETEAFENESEADYQANIALFFEQMRGDIPSAFGGDLDILHSLLGRFTGASSTDVIWSGINQAIISNSIDPAVHLITTLDVGRRDGVHLDDAGYITLEERRAQKILHILGYETVSGYMQAELFQIVNTTTTDITISHSMGTDFTPVSGIDIFDVYLDSVWTSTTGVRLDPTTVRLTHTAGTVTDVRGLYGKDPDTTNILKDNSALNMPIMQNYGIPSIPPVDLTVSSMTVSSEISDPFVVSLPLVNLFAENITVSISMSEPVVAEQLPTVLTISSMTVASLIPSVSLTDRYSGLLEASLNVTISTITQN